MSTFDYRRRLETRELLALAGAAAGAGAALAGIVFYLGRVWMQRVPIDADGPSPGEPVGPGADPAMRALVAGERAASRV